MEKSSRNNNEELLVNVWMKDNKSKPFLKLMAKYHGVSTSRFVGSIIEDYIIPKLIAGEIKFNEIKEK